MFVCTFAYTCVYFAFLFDSSVIILTDFSKDTKGTKLDLPLQYFLFVLCTYIYKVLLYAYVYFDHFQ